MQFMLTCCLAVAVLLVLSPALGSSKKIKICHTKHCKHLAEEYHKNRNLSVNPCENYYEYACGLWGVNHPIPAPQVLWSPQQIIQQKTHARLRDLLMEPISENDIDPVKKTKLIYRSCLNTEAIKKKGIDPLLAILESTGGWPATMGKSAWDPNYMHWQQIDKYYFRLLGHSVFYKLAYEPDDIDPNKNVLVVEQNLNFPLNSKINIDDLLKLNDPYINALLLVILNFSVKSKDPPSTTQIAIDVVDMVDFELNVLRMVAGVRGPYGIDSTLDKMTLAELQEYYDQSNVTSSKAKMNFLNVIKYVFAMADIEIDSSEPLLVYNKHFYHQLATYLETVPERVIVNYIQWNVVNAYLSYTTPNMRRRKFDMLYADFNVTGYPPRWQSCITDLKVKDALSYMFVKRHSSEEVVQRALDMTQEIQDELQKNVDAAPGLVYYVKEFMKSKLQSIKKEIGYPEWYDNDTLITQEYDRLKVGNDYFQNAVNYKQYELIKDLKELRGANALPRWLAQPTVVNAFYSPLLNTILIPASELQDPYFTATLPEIINHGAVGLIIGHELSHSIDSSGILFDKEGNRFDWPSWMLESYVNKTSCFVDQYGQYEYDQEDKKGNRIKLDGVLTLGENIADNTGLQASYHAYKTAQAERKYEMRLPGLEDVSEDELFFLSFANAWCSNVRPEFERFLVNSDEHSPERFRVIGSVSNMKEFSETYKCPAGSPMNPDIKCNLWT